MRNRKNEELVVTQADRAVLQASLRMVTVGALVASAVEDGSLDVEDLTEAIAEAEKAIGDLRERADALTDGGVQ